jgi:hypothetical protein
MLQGGDMEAICKVDYDLRVEASTKAVKEKERMKKRLKKQHVLKRRAEEKGFTTKRSLLSLRNRNLNVMERP